MTDSSTVPYRFRASHLHWLSLDVVAGAVVSHIAANRMPTGRTPLNIWVTIILGLVVLGIYTLDHLLDNQKPEQPRTQRHSFIRDNEAIIWRLTLGSLGLAVLLSLAATYLTPDTFQFMVFPAIVSAGARTLPRRLIIRRRREALSALLSDTLHIVFNVRLIRSRKGSHFEKFLF